MADEVAVDESGNTHVSLRHLLRGIDLAEGWRANALELLAGLAPSKFERYATRLVELVRSHPHVSRRNAMRALRLSKKVMTDLEETLEERGEVVVTRTRVTGGMRVTYGVP